MSPPSGSSGRSTLKSRSYGRSDTTIVDATVQSNQRLEHGFSARRAFALSRSFVQRNTTQPAGSRSTGRAAGEVLIRVAAQQADEVGRRQLPLGHKRGRAAVAGPPAVVGVGGD